MSNLYENNNINNNEKMLDENKNKLNDTKYNFNSFAGANKLNIFKNISGMILVKTLTKRY